MVTGFGLFGKAMSTTLGGQLLADASAFVQVFDTMFGGFRERATTTYELLRSPGTSFVVVAAPEADPLREAAYFVDRLATERMPLAGLVLNRTHPLHADLSATRAEAAAKRLEVERGGAAGRGGSAAARRPGCYRGPGDTVARTVPQGAPVVPVVTVPAMARNVHDLPGLREMGHRLADGIG